MIAEVVAANDTIAEEVAVNPESNETNINDLNVDTGLVTGEPEEFVPEKFESTPTLIGKVFVGSYLGIFGWFVIHSLVYFCDLLIPWHITWFQYAMYYGCYVVALILAILLILSFAAILLIPSCSSEDALRFHIRILGTTMLQLLYLSNLLGEPMSTIGSSWFSDDLRYPVFLSASGFYLKFMFFMVDTAGAFTSTEDGVGSTHLFRPFWKSRILTEESAKYEENLLGILALAYIYMSYWFIIFAVTGSYVEMVLAYVALNFARFSFGFPPTFFRAQRSFFLAFVVIYALARAYFAYDEWLAHGSIWLLAGNMLFCLSHLIIFAGWYCSPLSKMGKLFVPFKLALPTKED